VGGVGGVAVGGCGRCGGVGSLLTFDIPQTALVATLDTYDFVIYLLTINASQHGTLPTFVHVMLLNLVLLERFPTFVASKVNHDGQCNFYFI
jgi:hypothetical protein